MFEKDYKRVLPLFEWKPVKMVTIRHHAIKFEQNIPAKTCLIWYYKSLARSLFNMCASRADKISEQVPCSPSWLW